MKSLFFSAVLLGSFSVFAGVCDNLGRFSCSPGGYDDGTGRVMSYDDYQGRLRTFADETRSALREKIRNTIRSPEGRTFRNNSLSALGLNDSPVCGSAIAADSLSEGCEQLVIDGISRVVELNSFGPELNNAGAIAASRVGDMTDLRFVVGDQNFLNLVSFVNEKADHDLVNHEVLDRVRDDYFPEVRQLILTRIRELNIPEATKTILINKISSIQFMGYDCSQITPGAQQHSINQLLVTNAFYDPGANTFRFCNGFALQSTSAFSIVGVIAHELGHSIDPCNVEKGAAGVGIRYSNLNDIERSQRENPFGSVLQCLRSEASVHAVNFSQQQGIASMPAPTPGGGYGGGYGGPGTPGMGGPGVQSAGVVSGAPPGPPSNVTSLPNGVQIPAFCTGDQIGESFADWLAAEVVPRYMETHYTNEHALTPQQYQLGYANIFRVGCNTISQSGLGRDNHPPIVDRVNRIIAANPRVRAQMGCTGNYSATYCNSETPLVGVPPPVMGSPIAVPNPPATGNTSPPASPTSPGNVNPGGTAQ